MITKLAGYELGHAYLQGGSLKYKVTNIIDKGDDWAVTRLYADGRETSNPCPRWYDIELPIECYDNCQDGRTTCRNCEKRFLYLKTKEEII